MWYSVAEIVVLGQSVRWLTWGACFTTLTIAWIIHNWCSSCDTMPRGIASHDPVGLPDPMVYDYHWKVVQINILCILLRCVWSSHSMIVSSVMFTYFTIMFTIRWWDTQITLINYNYISLELKDSGSGMMALRRNSVAMNNVTFDCGSFSDHSNVHRLR